jgi:hypothetical protein
MELTKQQAVVTVVVGRTYEMTVPAIVPGVASMEAALTVATERLGEGEELVGIFDENGDGIALVDYGDDEEWHVIGRVAVDTGTIVITDPCNADGAADAWDGYVENGCNGDLPVVSIGSKNPHQAAVFTETGFGDGYYGVEARYAADRVAELRIIFIGEDEEGLYAKGWFNKDGSEYRVRPPWLSNPEHDPAATVADRADRDKCYQ